PRPAAEPQHLAEHEQLQPVVVVDGGSALAGSGQALAQVGGKRARRAVRLGVADHGVLMLNVVVERVVDVGDLAAAEGDESEPVVVERCVMYGRKREGVL